MLLGVHRHKAHRLQAHIIDGLVGQEAVFGVVGCVVGVEALPRALGGVRLVEDGHTVMEHRFAEEGVVVQDRRALVVEHPVAPLAGECGQLSARS